MAMGGNLRRLSDPGAQAGLPRPQYHYTLPLYGAITLVLYLLATRLVQPTQHWRVRWKEVVTVVVLLLALGGGVALAFALTADRYAEARAFAPPTPAPAMVPPVPPPVMVEQELVFAPEPTKTPTPTPTDPLHIVSPLASPTPAPSEGDQAAMYAAVVRQLYTVDHTFGDSPPNFPVVYLVRTTDDGVGDPDAPHADPRVLPESTQAAIVAALNDLPAEFLWVDGADEVPYDDSTGAVAGGGATITLGNVHIQEDSTALVSAKLFFAMLGATGKTYVLEQLNGAWQVTGDTGVQWMS